MRMARKSGAGGWGVADAVLGGTSDDGMDVSADIGGGSAEFVSLGAQAGSSEADPVSITDADGGVAQFSYDTSGDLTSLTDPDQNTTTWTVNSQDKATQQTDPQGNSASFAYNSSGQLVSYTDMDGGVRRYQYDTAGHVTTETLYASAADAAAGQNAEDTLQYAYDTSGNLTSESDDDSSDTYTYDSQNRLTAPPRRAWASDRRSDVPVLGHEHPAIRRGGNH